MNQELTASHNWQLVNGLQLHARAQTNPLAANSIVFISGLSISSYYMLPTMRELADEYSVYAPDLPGVGHSDRPDRALTISELAKVLEDWLAAQQLVKPILLGNSFGCQIIAELLARIPDLARAVVLVSPTINPHKRSFTQQFFPFLGDVLYEPMSLIPIALGDYFSAGFRQSWHTLQYALQDPIEKKLPLIRVPALVVKGEFDPIVPQDWAEEAAKLIPNGSLKVVKMAGHAVNYGYPKELADLVREFLGKQQRNQLEHED